MSTEQERQPLATFVDRHTMADDRRHPHAIDLDRTHVADRCPPA